MTSIDAWLADFIATERSSEHVEAWVARTWAAIRTDVPAVDAMPDLAEPIQGAIEEHWRAFLDHLETRSPYRLPPTAADLADELARRHLDVTLLLAVYRAAQRASWTYATEIVREAPAALSHEEILVVFWTEAAAWLDSSVEESLLRHQTEATRIRQRGEAQRFEAVQTLLTGDAASADPRALSAALGGYPLGDSHLALVLSARTHDALALLEPTLVRVAARLGSRAPLTVRSTGREVWGWIPAATAPAADTVAELDLDPNLRLTLAGPHPGIDGFVLAHTEARAAIEVALRRPQPVTTYDGVAAVVLLSADPDAADRFARRVLGPLADPDQAVLRETVRTVFTTDGGADAVAEQLGVHRNTVRYRMAQAEKLLGRPVQERLGDLLLAIDYLTTQGA